jgi:hypothetical protein
MQPRRLLKALSQRTAQHRTGYLASPLTNLSQRKPVSDSAGLQHRILTAPERLITSAPQRAGRRPNAHALVSRNATMWYQFLDGPSGRRASLLGRGLDVWEVPDLPHGLSPGQYSSVRPVRRRCPLYVRRRGAAARSTARTATEGCPLAPLHGQNPQAAPSPSTSAFNLRSAQSL